jgi:5-formyltetrahydrofolate cyclo-ligase
LVFGTGQKHLPKMSGSETIARAKQTLRERIRDELRKMTPAQRAELSAQACRRLQGEPAWSAAESILFYAPMPEEVDIWPLAAEAQKAGKRVVLPRYNPDDKRYVACDVTDVRRDLNKGRFGIPEPGAHCLKISSNRLDLILVPGLAFDFDGHRLGRGKGFYDQLLSVLQGPTCGVAFDQQMVGHIPTEPHDIRLSCILTPTRWHCVREPRAVLK